MNKNDTDFYKELYFELKDTMIFGNGELDIINKFEDIVSKVFAKGFNHGVEQGKSLGYSEGYKEGLSNGLNIYRG